MQLGLLRMRQWIADPPVHTAHRGTVFPELVARRMAALRPDIEALADGHLAKALSGRGFHVPARVNSLMVRRFSSLPLVAKASR
jgi:cytochrome P450